MALKMFVDAQRPANDGVSRCPMQPGDDLPQVPSIDGSIRWCPNKAHQSWTHKASMTKGYWKPARRMALVEALWFFFSLVEIMFEEDPGPTAAQENTTTMFLFLFMLRRLPWAQAKIEASFKRGVLVKHCVLWSWLRFHKSFLVPSNPELQALTVLKFVRCWQADPLWVDARQCTPIWKLARGVNDPMQAAFITPRCHRLVGFLFPQTVVCWLKCSLRHEGAQTTMADSAVWSCTRRVLQMFLRTLRLASYVQRHSSQHFVDWLWLAVHSACLPLCRYLPHFFRFESQALQTGNALMDSRKEDRLLNKLHLTLKKQQNKTWSDLNQNRKPFGGQIFPRCQLDGVNTKNNLVLVWAIFLCQQEKLLAESRSWHQSIEKISKSGL